MKKLRIAYMFFTHTQQYKTNCWVDIRHLVLFKGKHIIFTLQRIGYFLKFKNIFIYSIKKHFYFTQLHALKYFNVFLCANLQNLIKICIVLAQGILQFTEI